MNEGWCQEVAKALVIWLRIGIPDCLSYWESGGRSDREPASLPDKIRLVEIERWWGGNAVGSQEEDEEKSPAQAQRSCLVPRYAPCWWICCWCNHRERKRISRAASSEATQKFSYTDDGRLKSRALRTRRRYFPRDLHVLLFRILSSIFIHLTLFLNVAPQYYNIKVFFSLFRCYIVYIAKNPLRPPFTCWSDVPTSSYSDLVFFRRFVGSENISVSGPRVKASKASNVYFVIQFSYQRSIVFRKISLCR